MAQWFLDDAELDQWDQNFSEDALAQTSLFSITGEPGLSYEAITITNQGSQAHEDDHVTVGSPPFSVSDEHIEAIRELSPELFPQSPPIATRQMFLAIDNPYLENNASIIERHPRLRRPYRSNTTIVNGYLKFVIRSNGPDHSRDVTHGSARLSNDMAIHHRSVHVPGSLPRNNVRWLPPNFGSYANIDVTDRKILEFYTTAICGGRTLLPKTNPWIDMASVVDGDECARHAALAFSAGYMLDYVPREKLRIRANFHYKRASELLTLALKDPMVHTIGKGDAVVTALMLLLSDDIVQWELRRSKDMKPRWRCGSKTAKAILDATDPGYRYWRPENVQTTSIRRSNANMCAYVEICALPVTELRIMDFDKLYTWLLEGSEKEVREIHGGTGVCPKLMHIYAQITQLSARIVKEPDSPIFPPAANAILSQLANFRQTSELSTGYETTKELLDACVLDQDGMVQCAIKVTELTAATWVQAAEIYLYCRFYRLPRYHPKVIHSLSMLLQCVRRMPTKGELFTAQSPFFCIFMAGLVAYREEDRLILDRWYDVVVSGGSGRSSVPPVWEITKAFWRWIDLQPYAIPTDDVGDHLPLSKRRAWWEDMVRWFLEHYGELSLA
ncbi:fungal-specific transcription factor domain-containing protein [Nemania sp. FL0031]|nr:fungal-specific transcription factor domain-containing protein [Nemania sp. FL0031]